MTPLPVTPLENWVRTRMGLAAGVAPTAERLARYQLARLNETLAHAAANSPFYRAALRGRVAGPLVHLDEIDGLPFTTPEMVRRAPLDFLATSQDDVARAVTVHTTGTTGAPKRVFFSGTDLADTIDFFGHGMGTMVTPGQRVLILLPGELPDSVGDLLHRALAGLGVEGIVYGVVQAPEDALAMIVARRIDCIVGIPVQVLALARHAAAGTVPSGRIKSVLLSTDYVPAAIVRQVRAAWGCEVFQHYGMTEMGYGGAVSCRAHDGYHLREAELLFEIIDPQSLQPVADGAAGEVVFTTLSRRTMPLIRYRTGDLAAWINEPCPCGTVLRRMQWVRGRRREAVLLADGSRLTLAGLDEALFALPGVVNFHAALIPAAPIDQLQVTVYTLQADAPVAAETVAEKVATALKNVPALRSALAAGVLALAPPGVADGAALSGGVAKRSLVDKR